MYSLIKPTLPMRIINVISFLLCGISVGWLMGLSASPLIQTVIGSLLAIISSVMTILFSLQEGGIKDKITDKLGEINIVPLALFLIGLASAGTAGIYARTNDWFGINPISFREKWQVKDSDSSGVIKHLYNLKYGQETKLSDTNNGVLFANNISCETVLGSNDVDFIASTMRETSPEYEVFVDSLQKHNPNKSEQLVVLKNYLRQTCK